MTDGPSRYDGVSIVAHFNAVLAERDKAIALAHHALTDKLVVLNGHQEEMRRNNAEMKASFYGKDAHEVYAHNIDEEFKRIRQEIQTATMPDTHNRFWYVGPISVLIVAGSSGLWVLATNISRIDNNQKAVLNQLVEHDQQMKDFERLHPIPPKR